MPNPALVEPAGQRALHDLWRAAGLPAAALSRATLTGADPVWPSSFAVGAAAQASIAAAALAATEIGWRRNDVVQSVAVDCRDAALECSGHFTLDGVAPRVWDPIAGLYRCGRPGDAGWLRLHTNFAHHRDGVLRLLGLPAGAETPRATVTAALADRGALEFETAATAAGLVVAALRSFDAWDVLPQAAVLARQPLVAIERIGDAPPLALPALQSTARPLDGVRVVELTRILAGPVGGRTLAAYGADVMLVNAPHLPNIAAIADTSRGKRSAHADLREPAGRAGLCHVLRDAHVFIDGYRPGALAALAAPGFGALALAAQRPGIVVVSLSAYGEDGAWGGKRGFDSLVQTATGFNVAEAAAAGATEPKAMPVQILDMATGFLIAFGAQAALLRQQAEGGSWRVRVTLARTGLWLREFDRVADGFDVPAPAFDGALETGACGFGELAALRHAARFSDVPAGWQRESMPPGSDPLAWSAA